MKRIYLVMAGDGEKYLVVVATTVESVAEEIAAPLLDAKVETVLLLDDEIQS